MKHVIILILLVFAFSTSAAATEDPPIALIQDKTAALLSVLTTTPGLRSDPEGLKQLVHRVILPHVDVQRFSMLILDKYWRQVTTDQRKRFANEFTDLLVRTYATSLAEFNEQQIQYLQMPTKKPNRTVVRTIIDQHR